MYCNGIQLLSSNIRSWKKVELFWGKWFLTNSIYNQSINQVWKIRTFSDIYSSKILPSKQPFLGSYWRSPSSNQGNTSKKTRMRGYREDKGRKSPGLHLWRRPSRATSPQWNRTVFQNFYFTLSLSMNHFRHFPNWLPHKEYFSVILQIHCVSTYVLWSFGEPNHCDI